MTSLLSLILSLAAAIVFGLAVWAISSGRARARVPALLLATLIVALAALTIGHEYGQLRAHARIHAETQTRNERLHAYAAYLRGLAESRDDATLRREVTRLDTLLREAAAQPPVADEIAAGAASAESHLDFALDRIEPDTHATTNR